MFRRTRHDRAILALAVPSFGALVAEPLYVLTDTAIVGHLGTDELAGLAIAAAVLLSAHAALIFLAYGTTGIVGRLRGSGDNDGAIVQGVQALWLATILGGITCAGLAVLSGPIVDLFDPAPAVREHALTYLRISLIGLTGMFVVLAGTGFLAFKVFAGGDGDKEEGPAMSFSSAISLLMGRSDAILASVPGGDAPADSLPLVLTADAVRIRSHSVLTLEDGKVPRKDAKGLMVPPLLLVLMAERSDVRPSGTGGGDGGEGAAAEAGPSRALGRGSDSLLVLAESGIPFATVARILYTAGRSSPSWWRTWPGGPSPKACPVAVWAWWRTRRTASWSSHGGGAPRRRTPERCP